MQKLMIAAVWCLLYLDVNGQENAIVEVLKKNQAGKEFYFDSSTTKDGLDEICIKYLGMAKANAGGKYKVLTWKRVWGPNKHTTGIIFIYSIKNEFVGKYHLGSGSDLPNKIEKNSLIFSNKQKANCDTTLVTKINFSKGLPEEIFLRCEGEYGDIYKLSRGDVTSNVSINILFSQDVDRKYIEVYNYFKGIKQGLDESFNVSPVIRFISIGSFLKKLDSLGNDTIAAELKDKEMFYKKNYFDPFINGSIDTIFSNTKEYNTYLLFSKPVENVLLVEVREGHYNLKNLRTPYFGTAMKYLFIFNNQNKIAQVLKDTIVYN